MYRNNLFESLKEVVDNDEKKRRKPKFIYKDETGQIKETDLAVNKGANQYSNLSRNLSTKTDGSAHTEVNKAKLIHDHLFT